MEGESPDPRDDIYAFGVVSYILLFGVDSFDHKPANLAKGLHLKPKRIALLSRAQNHALASALQLERDERTPDIETFLTALDESALEKKLKIQKRLIAVLGIGFVTMVGCVVYLMLR